MTCQPAALLLVGQGIAALLFSLTLAVGAAALELEQQSAPPASGVKETSSVKAAPQLEPATPAPTSQRVAAREAWIDDGSTRDGVSSDRNDGEPTAKATTWYGWQTLAADAGSLALLVTAASIGRPRGGVVGTIGLAGYGLGGPITHLAHGNTGRSLGSLALRAGLPPAGFLSGYLAARDCARDRSEDYCVLGGAFLGGLAGALGAIVLDATLLSRETREVPRSALSLVPHINVGRDTAEVGLGGAF